MAGIFLSYRRADATGWAGRLHDSLVQRLPGVKIFMDVEEIPPGVKFADYIHEAVGSCDVLLALIGPAWLTVTKDDGTRRLDDPHDFVRLEIAAAIERGVRVVPTLVGGAAMPGIDAVPSGLKELCDRQNYELPDRAWEDGCNRLARALGGIVKAERLPPSRPTAGKVLTIGGALAALALALGGTLWSLRVSKLPETAPAPTPVLSSASAATATPASAPASAVLPAPAPTPESMAIAKPAATRALAAASASATKPVAAAVPRPARSKSDMDEELWAAAEASQRRTHYIDYLFGFPTGVHQAAAQTKAGGFWLRDTSTGCATWQVGAPNGELPTFVWKGSCAGGKAQGKGTATKSYAAQKRRVVEESTLAGGLDSGPCSGEIQIDGTPRSRLQGTCQDFVEGSVAHKFEGTIETFDADGTINNTFTGTRSRAWTGEIEFRGNRSFPKTETTFSGTEKGDSSNGTVKLKSGTSTRCKFVKGQANGSGCEARYADGGLYKGDFVGGQRSGRGLLSAPTGIVYEGDFRDGRPWGQGVLSYPDGTKMIGSFVSGKVDGDTVLVDKTGQRTQAHFVAGTRDR